MDAGLIRRRLAKLFSRRSARRAAALAASLPRSAARLRALKAEAAREGRTLRLIVLPERMGDIVAAEPIARRLRAHSQDRLVWVIDGPFADLVRFNPNIDDLLEITCLTEWMALDALFPKMAKTRLLVDGIHCSWFGGPALANPNPFGIDMGTYFDHGPLLEVFARLGLGEGMDERPKAWPDPGFDPQAWLAAQDIGPFVAVHAGAAADAGRVWPPTNFQAVADWVLAHTDLQVLELGLEPALEPRARLRRLGSALPLSRQAAVIGQARAFLGGDSGFAHMANALALPAVILLAPYRHFGQVMPYSGPWRAGQGVTILRADGPIAGLSPEVVIQALDERLRQPRG